jgi:hypothetical protein
MRRALVSVVVVAAFAPSTAAAVGPSSGIPIAYNGRIGPAIVGGPTLRIGISTEADVRAFAGDPTGVRDFEGQFGGAVAPSRELMYRCGKGCFSAYWVNLDNDLLANFVTKSRRFRTSRGTRVGISKLEAQRREHRLARITCGSGTAISVRNRPNRVDLSIAIEKHVVALALASIPFGVLTC